MFGSFVLFVTCKDGTPHLTDPQNLPHLTLALS